MQGHSRFTQHVRLCQPLESPAQGIQLVTVTDDHETLTSSKGQLVITLRLPLKNLSCNITQVFTWQSEEPARLPSAFLSRAEPSVSPRPRHCIGRGTGNYLGKGEKAQGADWEGRGADEDNTDLDRGINRSCEICTVNSFSSIRSFQADS